MTPETMAEKLRSAADLIREVSATLDDSTSRCSCCGLDVRQNQVDWAAKQALDGAETRVAKVLGKLLSGEWEERALLPVEAADTLRGDGS